MDRNRLAVGARVHAGWAAVAVVTGSLADPHILARRKLTFVPSADQAFTQPYHVAQSLGPQRGRAAVVRATESADALAAEAFRKLLADVAPSRVDACAVLTSRAREPAQFETILRSHAMIHAAEGMLFREVTARAAAACGLDVQAFVEDDVLMLAARTAGTTAPAIERSLTEMRKALGAPWGRDEKLAALAALLVLDSAASKPVAQTRKRGAG